MTTFPPKPPPPKLGTSLRFGDRELRTHALHAAIASDIAYPKTVEKIIAVARQFEVYLRGDTTPQDT